MAKPTVVVPAKRRLTDLYTLGKTIVINDDQDDDPIEVYISKVTDLESKTCVEKSAAARAKYVLMVNDKTSPERDIFIDQLEANDLSDKDSLIEIVIATKIQESEQSHESRIASEDPWAENNLLISLRQAWVDGLEDRYAEDPEDVDAKRVYDELLKFAREVQEAVEDDRENFKMAFEARPYVDILDEAIDQLIEMEGNGVWVDQFQRWRTFYSVKEVGNKHQRYFESKDEVDRLDNRILRRLIDEYDSLAVSAMEGKD